MMRRGTRRTLLLDPDSLPKQDAKRKTATTESSSEQSDSQMILPQTVSAHELRSERLPPRQRRRRKVQRNETCPCCSFLLPLRQRPCTTKRSRSIYVTWAVTMLAAGVLLTSFASLFMALMFVGNFPTSSSQSPFFYLSFFGLQSLPFPIYGLRNDDVYGGRRRNLESLLAKQEFTVLFCVNRLGNRTSSVALPGKLDEESRLEAIKRDDGDLNVKIIEDEGFRLERRIIYHDFDQDMRYEDMINGPNDDDYIDNYYAFDDDERRNTIRAYADKTLYKSKKCRRTSWHRDLPINCNNVHEFDVEQRFRSGDTTFLGYVLFKNAVTRVKITS